ncbi:RES family NAD+ phosphorylase [Thalassospira marina]|uniref:RES family NAD+ phosphorylase n=1 Tax=Thalassospira marina TaxID=2048283 RepID=UPI001C06AB63|nr:RES family NAD+ phosphorylase [Thalassospira marina]
MIRASDLECRDFVADSTIRLIPTAYIDEPALGPLADDDEELDLLAEIEGLTSARLQPPLPLPGGLDPTELLSPANGYGWSYVNAAFCYTRTEGNRFNGPNRGAWYAALGDNATQTAQAEVAWHLTRELENTGVFNNITAYRELIAGFNAPFHDLAGHPQATALDPSPTIAYPAGQALAHAILASGGNGLLYPSVRHQGGHCIAALRPSLVQNIRQGDQWVFTWSGNPDPEITRT